MDYYPVSVSLLKNQTVAIECNCLFYPLKAYLKQIEILNKPLSGFKVSESFLNAYTIKGKKKINITNYADFFFIVLSA